MSNILAKTKQPQIEGLERIGWSLRKIVLMSNEPMFEVQLVT